MELIRIAGIFDRIFADNLGFIGFVVFLDGFFNLCLRLFLCGGFLCGCGFFRYFRLLLRRFFLCGSGFFRGDFGFFRRFFFLRFFGFQIYFCLAPAVVNKVVVVFRLDIVLFLDRRGFFRLNVCGNGRGRDGFFFFHGSINFVFRDKLRHIDLFLRSGFFVFKRRQLVIESVGVELLLVLDIRRGRDGCRCRNGRGCRCRGYDGRFFHNGFFICCDFATLSCFLCVFNALSCRLLCRFLRLVLLCTNRDNND